MIFESHAHYDDDKFQENQDEIIQMILSKDVSYVMNVAAELESMKKCYALTKKYSQFYASAGVHPNYTGDLPLDYIEQIDTYLQKEKVLAVGEIGLDYYYYDHVSPEVQKKAFSQQLALAKDTNYPVIVHSRDASQDTLDLLNKFHPKGVVHCFSGGKDMVEQLNTLDFYLGFTGVVTFKNAKKSIEALQHVPLNRLLIETDCPYMAPEPVRGTVNHSGNLIYIAQKIAEIKQVSTETIIQITTENAKELFDIS